MSRRVQRKLEGTESDENLISNEKELVDWTRLPHDTVITIFSCLNNHDRANLSSTCRTWRVLSKSPYLWWELDLRAHKCNAASTSYLASRCENLRKLHFRDHESADAILNLRAENLHELNIECCGKMTDATLCAIAARHKALECLRIGDCFLRIGNDALKETAICCRNLRRLWISGINKVDGNAIDALAKNCRNLTDVGFIDCTMVDETALGNLASVRLLSIAGTTLVKWDLVVQKLSKLPFLIGLDVSRTDVCPNNVSGIFLSSFNLTVLCALNCPELEEDANFVSKGNNRKGKVVLSVFTDILKKVAVFFVDGLKNDADIFEHWRNLMKDTNLFGEILNWLEWIVCDSLLHISESGPHGLDKFWLNQGTGLLLGFLQSDHEEIQEMAATGLANFASTYDDEKFSVNTERAEAVIRGDGICLLLNLARSWREGLQLEAVKAIANLSVNAKIAKVVVEEGGISILVNLARSVNRLVAEEGAGALWNISFCGELKCAIDEAFGVKALVDLIYQWSRSTGGERVLERVVGVLANLAADNKSCVEFASVGGVHALVTLTRTCEVEGVQEQAAQALSNLASHWDTNGHDSPVGQMTGAFDALVQLTRSRHDGVRQQAACALRNLSYEDRNREAIAAAGGVEALVALANSCSNSSPGLQQMAAGALWGLSESETYSIAIGRAGGVTPLIALVRSDAEDVHETAVGALWNLAFYPVNALRIMDEGGIDALAHHCSSSPVSKMTRFMSALAMAYMLDERVIEIALIGTSTCGTSKSVGLNDARGMAMKHIEDFLMTVSDPELLSAAATTYDTALLVQVTECARIEEACQLRCSRDEIERFVAMLQDPCPALKSCAAFTLFQFTIPGDRYSSEHTNLLRNAGAPQVLRLLVEAVGGPPEAKLFANIVLRNMEKHV